MGVGNGQPGSGPDSMSGMMNSMMSMGGMNIPGMGQGGPNSGQQIKQKIEDDGHDENHMSGNGMMGMNSSGGQQNNPMMNPMMMQNMMQMMGMGGGGMNR